jgi:hypothetical protein
MKKICFIVVAFCCAVALASSTTAPFSAEHYLSYVKYLASDQLKGRGNNLPELSKAASYIEGRFRKAGLKDFASLDGYRQYFEVTAQVDLLAGSHLQIGAQRYALDKDFSLLSFADRSDAGERRKEGPVLLLMSGSGPAIFCGHGVAAIQGDYDDYAGKEVHGKVAVVLDGAPSLTEKQKPLVHSDLLSKIVLAKNKGAAALLLVRDPSHFSSRGAEQMGMPAFAVTPELAANLLGVDAAQLGNPHAEFHPAALQWNVHLEKQRRRVANVVAYLAGSPMPQEWVVVGAHYDHLGLGERYALDPNAVGQPHNGADDNASGTAGVICLGENFAGHQPPLARGIVFIAFAGEELGLLGSAYFVDHLPAEVKRVAAMVNMDMIGRPQGKFFLGGVGTAKEFPELLKDWHADLKIEVSDNIPGGSDHVSFTAHGIPALFFFSGLHSDYHKATDDWEKIDVPKALEVLDVARQAVRSLTASEMALHFTQPAEPKSSGGGSGYGAYFGSVPDFASGVNGVRFSDVAQGSPAHQAGLRGGDTLVKFDGKPVENLYDFTYALRSHAPGQTVEVEYLRDGKLLKASVTLGTRN